MKLAKSHEDRNKNTSNKITRLGICFMTFFKQIDLDTKTLTQIDLF